MKKAVLATQHNNLINAKFNLTPVELKIFLSMLSRVKKEDKEFQDFEIPLSEFLSKTTVGGSTYENIKAALKRLMDRKFIIEDLWYTDSLDKKTLRRYTLINLMSKATYFENSGYVQVKFNDDIKPYLLELSGNFTQAEIEVLLKFKSYYSYRLYLLLKQYNLNQRTFDLEELKEMFQLEGKYENFKDFKNRVLNYAQKELEKTDMAFTFEVIKIGKFIKRIKFSKNNELKSIDADKWNIALIKHGISRASIQKIENDLVKKEYDEGYIFYVINYLIRKKKENKITKLNGAIYTSITEKYLLDEYLSSKKTKVSKSLKQKTEPTFQKFTLKSQREIYDYNVSQGINKYDSFNNFIKTAFLKEGFKLREENGEQYLIKE